VRRVGAPIILDASTAIPPDYEGRAPDLAEVYVYRGVSALWAITSAYRWR
jgi:hypothetical protein